MKLTLFSDIHLEFSPLDPPLTDADVLVLAGDIFVLYSLKESHYRDRVESFLSKVSEHYPHVIAIAGNHEYYGSDINTADAKLRELYAGYGITFLQNQTIEIDGVTILGTTLWSDINPLFQLQIQSALADYGTITYDDDSLLPHHTQSLYMNSIDWIAETLSQSTDPHIVVTHHAPSYESVAPKYRVGSDSTLNSAFASNLNTMIEQYSDRAQLWCHGHVHHSNDYMIGDARIISNPRGYPMEHQYSDWDREHVITIYE